MNCRYLDKQNTLHLGKWPEVGLAEARAKRDEPKQKVAAGFDPAVEKKRAHRRQICGGQHLRARSQGMAG